MRTNKIKVDFCDFCEVTKDNANEKIGREKCIICERWNCRSEKCIGAVEDNYWTTAHLPTSHYDSRGKFPFICKECWDKATKISSDEIKKGVDIHGSGSSWAIRLGEYATMVYDDGVDKTIKATVDEIKRLISLLDKRNKESLEKAKLQRKVDSLKRKIDDPDYDYEEPVF